MPRKYFILVIFTICTLLLCAATEAQDVGSNQEAMKARPLKGLSVVHPEVFLDKAATDAGLSSPDIQTSFELALIDAGLKVRAAESYPLDGSKIHRFYPFLMIEVDSLTQDDGVLIYEITLSLNEDVSLQRKPSLLTDTDTWSDSEIGYCSSNKAGVLHDTVDREIKHFVKDYNLVNTQ